jgi:integrase
VRSSPHCYHLLLPRGAKLGTIIRRGESWRAVIRKKGHRARTKTFKRRGAAQRWVREVEIKMDRLEASNDHHDLGYLIQRYVDEIGGVKSWGRSYRAGVLRLKRDFGGTTLSELTPALMLEWARKRKAGPATLTLEQSFLGAVLHTAEALWDVRVDWPTIKRGRYLIRSMNLMGKAVERDRRVEPGEIERIKAELRSTLPMEDLIDFAIDSAMRAGEITRIRWVDLDDAKRTVLIRDRKHPSEKIGNHQRVPLLGRCWEIVQRQPRGDERIFPYDERSMTTAFQRARRRAGVDGLRFHDLRHEGISRLFERGMQIQQVALVSGHRSWSMLKRYTNLKPESLHAHVEPSTSG